MTKKKSFWAVVFAFCLIVPCMIMFAACGGKEHEHTYKSEWSKNATHHWLEATCEHTDVKGSEAEHTFGAWTTKVEAGLHKDKVEERKCSVCEYAEERTVAGTQTHQFANTWLKDASGHWHECSCGKKTDVIGHKFGNWETKTPGFHQDKIEKRICTECGYEETRTVANSAFHDYEPVWVKGEKTHWFECECGAKAYEEAHTFGDWSEKTPAGVDQNRQLSRKCTECEYEDVLTFDNTNTNGSYCMVITNVIQVSGGKVVQVKILRGTISIGDNVSVDGINGTFTISKIRINMIEAESASCSQEVDLTLDEEDGNLDDIDNNKSGSLMYVPNTIKSYKKFTAQIYFYEKDDTNNVGRNTPIFNGISSLYTVLFDGKKQIKCTITLPEGVEMIKPGETMIVTITLDSENALWEGLDFNIKDGTRILTKGTILKVVGE